MAEYRSRILGLGTFVPDNVVTNYDLEKMMDTSHDWIVERSGIEERRWVPEGMGNADMGIQAARQALENAQVDASEIDCIIYATLSPDVFFPGSGVFIQRELGAGHIPAYDIREQCSGFVYGLQMADMFIRAGQYEKILLIGSEVHSNGLDKTTRGRTITVLFGDGAGAAVIGRSESEDSRILSSRVHCDGSGAEQLWMELPSFRRNPSLSIEDIEQGRHYPTMDGQKVFKQAVTRMPQVVKEVLELEGLTLDDLDMLIPHQANLRINEMVGKMLRLPPEKVHNNIQKYGNTTAATIPLCMKEAVDLGKIKPGDLVCCVAFGSGFTWGAVLLRY